MSRARLVLHGVDVFPLRLNDIRSAGQAKRLGPKRDSPEDAFAAFGAMFSAVNPTVRPRASNRVCVVAPNSVAVNKGALSWTVGEMLDRRDRHHGFGIHRRSAPMARVVSAVARRW